MTRVWTSRGSTSLPAGPAHLQAWHRLKKKASCLAPSQHPFKHHSTGTARLTEMPVINTRSFPISTEILHGATRGSDMKTLQSSLLLRYLQLDGMIPVIHGSSYTVRSSSCSERCNPPYQCGQLWMVVDISACNLIIKRRGQLLQGDHNVRIMQLCRSEISTLT